MKIKILIAILAAVLLAYAGIASAQIIIIDPKPPVPGESYETCRDLLEAEKHLMVKTEFTGVKTPAGIKHLRGHATATGSHYADKLCCEYFIGVDGDCVTPEGFDAVLEKTIIDAEELGFEIPAGTKKMMFEYLEKTPAPNLCDWKMCACPDPYDCNKIVACPIPPLKLYSPEGCDEAACVPGEFNGQFNVCEEALPLPPCVCVDEMGVGWGDKNCIVDDSVPACCTSWDIGCFTKLGDPISCDLPCDTSLAAYCEAINLQPDGCAMPPYVAIKCQLCSAL